MRQLVGKLSNRIYRVVAGSGRRIVRVRHFRGHGVHSPFVYELVRQVFMKRLVEGCDSALYTELILKRLSIRRATQLQNLYTHCGYRSYCFAAGRSSLQGIDLCIVLREGDLAHTLKYAALARESGTTLCILAPNEERARYKFCRRIVHEHTGTSIDNRGYLLLFNDKRMPKQHFKL